MCVYAATFGTLVGRIFAFLKPLAAIFIGFGVLLVVFGFVRFITAGGDMKRRSEARTFILWCIIALFVMISFWGFVNLLLSVFFDQSNLSPTSFDLSQLFR